jgi:hypothetical protein
MREAVVEDSVEETLGKLHLKCPWLLASFSFPLSENIEVLFYGMYLVSVEMEPVPCLFLPHVARDSLVVPHFPVTVGGIEQGDKLVIGTRWPKPIVVVVPSVDQAHVVHLPNIAKLMYDGVVDKV